MMTNLNMKDIFSDDFIDVNEKHFSDLKQSFLENDISFVLGAGISKPAGLPDWSHLLARALGMCINFNDCHINSEYAIAINKITESLTLKERKQYNEKINNCIKNGDVKSIKNINLLELGEYISDFIDEKRVEGEQKLSQEISEAYLVEMVKSILQTPFVDKKILKKKLSNSSLSSVVSLIQHKNSQHSYPMVITYNYDNILEYYLEYVKHINFNVINPKDVKIEKNMVNIYHPHGQIDILNEVDGEHSDKIILNESSYYDVERSEYGLTNSFQAYSFLNGTCIFVGFSASDYNFKRIIKNTDIQDARQHYMFCCIDDILWAVMGQAVDDQYSKAQLDKLYNIIEDSSVSEKDKNDAVIQYISTKKEEINGKDISETKANILKKLLKDKNYTYEKKLMMFIINSQHNYWKKYHITPIWVTISELSKKLRDIIK